MSDQIDTPSDGTSTGPEPASAGDSEAISDIQNYLASFNKEIQGDGASSAAVTAGDAVITSAETDTAETEPSVTTADGTTTFYVTQTADGFQYATSSQAQFDGTTTYYTPAQATFYTTDAEQATEGTATVTGTGQLEAIQGYATTADGKAFPATTTTTDGLQQIVLAVGKGQGAEAREIAVTIPDSIDQVRHESTEELLKAVEQQGRAATDGVQSDQPTFVAMQSGTAHDGSDEQQVILNTGNSYQTVTIVPSDTNPGEVSYVLIVSQPDEGKEDLAKADMDMSVYDFHEGGDKTGAEVVTEEASTPEPVAKMRTIKIAPKKSQTVTQAHMCNYCNYTSPKRYLLSRHMKSHSEERPHKCSVCERGFKTLASLQNHVNTHTGTRPHQCKECDAAFTTSGELVRHVRYRHTHEKPHRCTECDYASVELSKLKRHMRCHTGERPYQCPHCTYASPDTYKLKRHLRIHTGEKPYECDVCHARFTQSNSLKAHKLIHSGNKPIFQCELCPTTCGRKTDLRIHVQKLHTSDKPLKCKRCGKSFPDRYTYKGNLIRHLAIHDPEATAAERAEAMRIGEPKGPGEEPDGEEDDYMMEDDEDDDMDDMGMEDGMVNEGQQVVVFEVIQIPAADGVTMEQHAIRAVPEDALRMTSNGSVITGADGQELTIIQQVPQDQSVVTEVVNKAGEEVLGMGKGELDAPQREAEMARRRLEQKQKDMEECFGFNDEEDETILAMPAAPGVNGPSEEKVQDGTTTTYILMQENGDAV
ncbi:hypothetical protein HPB49_015311 [Dermacentor silvarum]|uniref:Uncharacterized protein n=1 Tax=Dermacentor silvarum TaxID=543639 RepID=A0ACB8E199_DERSI|nr:hypothetical protein HPB49_015311 [Dermacentor silvarum]